MKNLLIIDDDRHLLESLRVVFSGAYQVRTALSAEEGFPILSEKWPDILLLDIILPGDDGIQLLQKVRQLDPSLPVVMISGTPASRPVMNALKLGAYDYIRKPFDIEELRLVVHRALEKSALERRVESLEKQLTSRPGLEKGTPLKQAVEAYERELILDALRAANGVQTHAADALGTTRRILRYRIEKLNISL